MPCPPTCSRFSSVRNARATSSTGFADESLVCHACRLVYMVEEDIPIMLIDEASPSPESRASYR